MKKVILVNKPKGISSFEVVKRVKVKYDTKKAGHAGTLDPLASGLMIIGINEGTKELKHFVGLDKVYEATILLGKKTETGDMEGEVIEEKEVKEVTDEKVEGVLASMVGELTLPVSLYSAVKRGGEPYYKKARRGERIAPPLRAMEVRRAVLESIEYKEEDVFIHCVFEVGSGTYIRSLAEEVGKRLGYPAVLADLLRTRIGDNLIEDAEDL